MANNVISSRKKIAIIGAGISGLVAAKLLAPENDIDVYEANDYIGGHTRTITVELEERSYNLDTGFIVYNDWTYPNFVKLITQNNIPSQPTTMSFSVSCEATGLEYNGTSLNGLFAQRRNLLRPSFHKMIFDIMRFNREAKRFLKENKNSQISFRDFLKYFKFGAEIQDFYIYPMASAIWSANPQAISMTPFHFFARFFENHGMLNIQDRPQWRVIKGGSREYIKVLTAGFKNKIRLNSPVKQIVRKNNSVEVKTSDAKKTFDYIVIAVHSDQALNLLSDPSREEREILGNISYQKNEAILHTDCTVLPKNKLAWASWNYHKTKKQVDHACVTYNMNILQSLETSYTFCVSLNYRHRIDPKKIINSFTFSHPAITEKAILAQKRHHEINGENRTFFCGAYWGFGFHEDGVNSSLKVCEHFGRGL